MTIDVIEKTENVLKKPDNFVCVMLNDDYTTFDAVIYILNKVFKKTFEQGEALAREVHDSGKAVVSEPIQLDVAETMATVAMDIAVAMEMPLKVMVEAA